VSLAAESIQVPIIRRGRRGDHPQCRSLMTSPDIV
jgi:hypothetical protein